VTDYSKATWGQNFIASVAGAVASITVAAPLDTIKTRIQNANFETKVHGLRVVGDLMRNEGPTAFFKGLTPKVRNHSMDSNERLSDSLSDPRRRTKAGIQLHARPESDTLLRPVHLEAGGDSQ
jgi:hypothetical protein